MQANTTSSQPKKLLDQVRDTLRVKHDNIRTEQTYLNWIKRYIFFHDKPHLKNRGAESFLMHLALTGKVPPLPRIRPSLHYCSCTAKCGRE